MTFLSFVSAWGVLLIDYCTNAFRSVSFHLFHDVSWTVARWPFLEALQREHAYSCYGSTLLQSFCFGNNYCKRFSVLDSL